MAPDLKTTARKRTTDALNTEAWSIMRRGFAAKKTSARISIELSERLGLKVNTRTIGRRAREWRDIRSFQEERREEFRSLVAAMKEGDLTSSEVIQALALQALMEDSKSFVTQNPLKVQSQNLRAEEISLKREALALKKREVTVIEEKLRLAQERERKAMAIAAELTQKATRGASLNAEDIARIREVYGLSAA